MGNSWAYHFYVDTALILCYNPSLNGNHGDGDSSKSWDNENKFTGVRKMLNLQINLPKHLEESLKQISLIQFNGDISQTVAELLREELETHLRFRIKEQRKPLRAYEFCGMWVDREDMKDSTEWVRKQRELWKTRLNDETD